MDAHGEEGREEPRGNAAEANLSRYEPRFLAKAIEQRRRALDLGDAAVYLEHLRAHEAERFELDRHLRVVFSEFFRNRLAFALLEDWLLPQLLSQKAAAGGTEVRVWSAGCAAGQEAYSVAILLEELREARSLRTPYRVFATDGDETALASARAGLYEEAAVGKVRLEHLRRYFTREGEAYRVASRLRERVDFSFFDLLGTAGGRPPASIYGDFDLVLCANVLLYYAAPWRQVILNRLQAALASGGFLVVGETERTTVEQQPGFRTVAAPAAVFQKWS